MPFPCFRFLTYFNMEETHKLLLRICINMQYSVLELKKRKIRNPPLGSHCITFPATPAPPLASPAPALFFKFVLLSLFEIIPQERETNKKSNMAWSQYNALDFIAITFYSFSRNIPERQVWERHPAPSCPSQGWNCLSLQRPPCQRTLFYLFRPPQQYLHLQ